METPTHPDLPHGRPQDRTGLVAIGLIVVLVGLFALAERWTDWDVPFTHAWWPFILIVLGAAKLFGPDRDDRCGHRRGRGGLWLIVVGVWGLVSESRLFGLGYGQSWPLLVIAAGGMMVWRAFDTPVAAGRQAGEPRP